MGSGRAARWMGEDLLVMPARYVPRTHGPSGGDKLHQAGISEFESL
jgi:hypothetical protein